MVCQLQVCGGVGSPWENKNKRMRHRYLYFEHLTVTPQSDDCSRMHRHVDLLASFNLFLGPLMMMLTHADAASCYELIDVQSSLCLMFTRQNKLMFKLCSCKDNRCMLQNEWAIMENYKKRWWGYICSKICSRKLLLLF